MIEGILIWFNALLNYILLTVLPAALIFAVGVLLIRIGMKLVTSILEKSKMEAVAANLILKVLKVALYALLALIVASKMGIDVTGIVALASVLTLAVSLSVQDLLTNLVSGFTLLYTKPFGAGDYVEIAGKEGTVQEIGLTYTKLATPDNKLIFIPNGSVTSAQIVNYTKTGTRRVDFSVTASYDAPIPTVLAALKEAAQVPGVMEDQEIFVAVDTYGDHSIAYVLRVWSKTDDYWTVKFAINENIKKVFDAKGVEMTYPHLNIHMSK
jgi:small conductance mechanosensitive channel